MTARKKTPAYHHGDLRAALKRGALELVREKGPRGFSLNEASRRAGVSVGAPYRHFEDKDALLAEIICDGNALLEAMTRRAAKKARAINGKMLGAGMGYLRFAAEHADYFAVMFQSGIEKAKYPEAVASGMRAFGVILELAEEREGNVRRARELAVAAWALVHGLATLRAEGALGTVGGRGSELKDLRPMLRCFLEQSEADASEDE